jgi:hypothetical protein
VLLSNVQAITLRKDLRTTHRRVPASLQVYAAARRSDRGCC